MASNYHFPDGLRRRGLRHFKDRPVVARKRAIVALVVFDVAIREDFGVAPKEGIVLGGWVDDKGCGFGGFVDVEDGDGAKARGLTATPQVPPATTATPRSSPLSKRISENLPVVLVEMKEGPCWAKNQSVVVGVRRAIGIQEREIATSVVSPEVRASFQRMSPAPAPLL